MKIVTTKQDLKNSRLIIPIDGNISIDSEGIAEVSPKAAALLVKNIDYWEFYKSDKKKDSEETEEETDEETTEKETEEETTEEETELKRGEEIKDFLMSKTLNELISYAEELKIPKGDYVKIKNSKKLMVSFLLGK